MAFSPIGLDEAAWCAQLRGSFTLGTLPAALLPCIDCKMDTRTPSSLWAFINARVRGKCLAQA